MDKQPILFLHFWEEFLTFRDSPATQKRHFPHFFQDCPAILSVIYL